MQITEYSYLKPFNVEKKVSKDYLPMRIHSLCEGKALAIRA